MSGLIVSLQTKRLSTGCRPGKHLRIFTSKIFVKRISFKKRSKMVVGTSSGTHRGFSDLNSSGCVVNAMMMS